MRALAVTVLMLVVQACLGQQKAPPKSPDNSFTALALLVGEFYFFHHAWPSSEKQFREFIPELARKSPPDSQKTIPTVWSQMHLRHVEFTPRGKDVLVRARFLEDGRDYSYAAVLHPGKTAEEIATRLTPK
jgi:hypothetical protein